MGVAFGLFVRDVAVWCCGCVWCVWCGYASVHEGTPGQVQQLASSNHRSVCWAAAALFSSASVVHQRACAWHSVRALCALRQLCRRAAVVQSRSAAGQAVGGHLSSWQGCVSGRPSAAQRGLACAASAGIACVHRDAGHRVGWRARARRGSSQASRNAEAQAGSLRSVAAIVKKGQLFRVGLHEYT